MNDQDHASFDARIADWLGVDPGEAPGQVLQMVLTTFPSIKQRRAVRPPWRFSEMTTTLKFTVAGLALVAVLLGGIFVLGPPLLANVATAPSPSPSPTNPALVSKIPKTIDKVVMWISSPDVAVYTQLNPGRRLAQVLEALGKSESDVEIAAAQRVGATPLLVIDAIRIHGADEQALMGAFSTAMAGIPNISPARMTLDGREVVTWKRVSDTTVVYAADDVVFFIQSIDPTLVSAALGTLP